MMAYVKAAYTSLFTAADTKNAPSNFQKSENGNAWKALDTGSKRIPNVSECLERE